MLPAKSFVVVAVVVVAVVVVVVVVAPVAVAVSVVFTAAAPYTWMLADDSAKTMQP